MPIRTIELEDHGQDFLELDVDDDGNIVGCRPFQERIWTQCRVVNETEPFNDPITPGDVLWITAAGRSLGSLNYPVAAIYPKAEKAEAAS